MTINLNRTLIKMLKMKSKKNNVEEIKLIIKPIKITINSKKINNKRKKCQFQN